MTYRMVPLGDFSTTLSQAADTTATFAKGAVVGFGVGVLGSLAAVWYINDQTKKYAHMRHNRRTRRRR